MYTAFNNQMESMLLTKVFTLLVNNVSPSALHF